MDEIEWTAANTSSCGRLEVARSGVACQLGLGRFACDRRTDGAAVLLVRGLSPPAAGAKRGSVRDLSQPYFLVSRSRDCCRGRSKLRLSRYRYTAF
jgi:hypothetical protein